MNVIHAAYDYGKSKELACDRLSSWKGILTPYNLYECKNASSAHLSNMLNPDKYKSVYISEFFNV